MEFQSDDQGFLIGETVQDIRRSNDLLNAIKSDVSAIKRAILGSVNRNHESHRRAATNIGGGERQTRSGTTRTRTEAVEPRQRRVSQNAATLAQSDHATVRPRSAGLTREAVNNAVINAGAILPAEPSRTRQERNAQGRFIANAASPARESVSPARRGANGRFTANGEGDGQAQRTLFNGLGDRIANAVTEANSGLEDVDPSVKAFNEVAQPLARTYKVLTGGDRDKTNDRWFRRIFGELRLFRRDETVFNRAANRSLHNIEGNPGGADGDDGDSGVAAGAVAGLFSRVAPMALAAIAGIGSTLLAGIGTVLGVIFSPIGLAIGAAATVAWGLFTEDGRKFFADVGGKIVEVWNSTLEFIKPVFDSISKKWDEGVKVFTDLWEPIAKFISDKLGFVKDVVSKAANTANSYIKEKTGVDVKETASTAYSKVKKAATTNVVDPAIESIKKGAGKAWDGTKTIGKNISERWNDAKQYLGDAADKSGVDRGLLAKIANFESKFNSEATPTQKDGTKLSTAHGYGQFLDSTWTEMLNKHGAKYGVENAGNLTKKEALKLRSNKELQAGMLAEYTKENTEKGRELGGTNDDANVYALHNLGSGGGANFLKALKANPNAPVNSVKGMSKKVISGNKSLYGDGTGTLQEAYANMGKAMSSGDVFAQDIRKTYEMPPTVPSSIQTASAPSFKIQPLMKPQPIAEAPPVVTPMASDQGRKNLSITVARGDVGQDVADRKIAHVVTGGLSG